MQSLAWYLRRLQGMSPAEIAWRLRSAARDMTDRYRFALGMIPAPRIESRETPFRILDIPVGAWAGPQATQEEIAWRDRLVQDADDIVAHRLTYFNLQRQHLGDPIDWNRDHACGKPTPMIFAPAIDYRDFRITGDCKLVWEPNRHHQLVVLGRAYRATGDQQYARAVIDQLDSWLRQNPFGIGMNWRSPLELGIRLINWVWAIDLIRDSGLWQDEIQARVLQAIYLHCWDITRKYSRGSSANNHLVGEAAGVYVASTYFPHLPGAEHWRNESRALLLREIYAQSYPDGCTREQALGYEFFVLQFYLFCGWVGDRSGDAYPPEYWSRFDRMLEFVSGVAEGGDRLPLFGDCDDGYVLNLGDAQHDIRALLCIGAIRSGRADFRTWAGSFHESAFWLYGNAGRERFDALPVQSADQRLASRNYAESGYYLLQYGTRGSSDRISVLFDCGELGQGTIAAHGHADALSFTLRAFGVDVLVDPGTYDYFTYPAWRNYFRSTRAHNCLVVDDADQSVMLGPFLWGSRAQASLEQWQPDDRGGSVTGKHDGYTRLTDPVIHRRTVTLDGPSGLLTIRDEIEGRSTHAIALYFQLSELCTLESLQGTRCLVSVAGGSIVLDFDPAMAVESRTGSEEPISGWVSRGYHRKAPATTLIARATCPGHCVFNTSIRLVRGDG